MSLFETKTADNFIFDEAHDAREQDSLSTPFLKKNVAYVVDQQAGLGSYTSGEVIIDSQAISASGNMIDWRNAYLAVPFQVKWDVVFGTGASAITNASLVKYALALKNMALVDTLKVEANGKTIITATQGLSHLANFKLLSTLNKSSLEKEGALINFCPDTQGQVGSGSSTSYNAANDWLATTLNSDEPIQANKGLVERQGNFLPTINTSFLTESGAKNEGMSWDYGTVPVNTSTTSSTPSDIHFVAIIKLKHLTDFFDKHPLARGVSYRFTLRFNQAISTVSHASSTTPFVAVPTVSTTQTSGSIQPAMFCAGPASMLGRLSIAAATTATSTITSCIDTTSNARFSGIRLYVPSYELEPSHQQQLISKSPTIKKNFMDMLTQTTQTYAQAGSTINVQVSTSCTNPRALIVIPRWSQTATGNQGQGYFSETSPLATAPSGTDPLLSLTNVQVKMGSNYVLPDRLYYNFQAFSEHLSSLFAQNGNESAAATTGLITKKMFDANHRYYAFDLSRYPEAMTDLPQMISFEGQNNSAVSVELLCILLYGRGAEFNLAQGSLTITA